MLPNQERIRTFGEKENYKYLGILEMDTIKQVEIKEKNNKILCQKNKKTSPNQKLCSRNLIYGINTFVSLL